MDKKIYINNIGKVLIRMRNISTKLKPSDFWNIGEYESWFSDMAREGLHLKKVGKIFAHFNHDEPRKMRYRIDVSQKREGDKTPEQEDYIKLQQKEKYSEIGWEYVTSYAEFNVYTSPVEQNAPELYTDPVEQSYSLDELNEEYKKKVNLSIIQIIFMIGLLFAAWYFDFIPYVDLVEGGLIKYSIIVILVLYNCYTSWRAATSIHILREKLLEGEPINHDAPWEIQYKVKVFVSCAFAICALIGSTLPFIQKAMTKNQTLPTIDNNLPIIRLADVEQNPNLERTIKIKKNVDESNFYSYRWSILAPFQYITHEEAAISDKVGKSGEVYSPILYTRAYKLKFSFMKEAFLSDLIDERGMGFNEEKLLEIKHPNFDKLIVNDKDYFKEFFAYKGNVVVCVRYYGEVDIDLLIDATAEKIALIKD